MDRRGRLLAATNGCLPDARSLRRAGTFSSTSSANPRPVAWLHPSDGRVGACRGMRPPGRRVADPLLELAQAFFELSAGERADVSIDDLCQFGGLGCRQL